MICAKLNDKAFPDATIVQLSDRKNSVDNYNYIDNDRKTNSVYVTLYRSFANQNYFSQMSNEI